MPCWTRTTTRVELEAAGLNEERLVAAAEAQGIFADVTTFGGKRHVSLRDRYGRPAAEVERIVRQEYGKRTVADGLKKFGFRVQKTTNTAENTVKLTVGR